MFYLERLWRPAPPLLPGEAERPQGWPTSADALGRLRAARYGASAPLGVLIAHQTPVLEACKESPGVDEERGGSPVSDYSDVKYDVNTKLYDGMQRRLAQRHMAMIALAGVIGTGLFLNSGRIIATAGPAGALLDFAVVGLAAYCNVVALGEMCVYCPISGGFANYAARFLHPSVGFALGWQVVYTVLVGIPSEIVAATVLLSYWDPAFPVSRQAAYIIAFSAITVFINLCGVRWYGEAEFILAWVKILLLVILVVSCLVINVGGAPNHSYLGFQYYRTPGAFAAFKYPGNKGKFLGWFNNLVPTGYAYIGMDNIALCAPEVQNPRRAIPKAVRRTFYRVAGFYCLAIFMVGLVIPYTDKRLLLPKGTAATSPFVLAISDAGIKGLPSVINAGVLSSALSSANSGLYGGSRQLYSLALRGYAPAIFSKTTRRGVPIAATIAVLLFLSLAFMSLTQGAATALHWLTYLTSLSGFIVWFIVALTYLRFRAGCRAQGIDRTKFWYANCLQPVPTWYVIAFTSVVIIFNGWKVFLSGGWDTTSFIISYINIPIFALLVAGYQVVARRPWLGLEDLDFFSNIPSDEEITTDEPRPRTLPGRIAAAVLG